MDHSFLETQIRKLIDEVEKLIPMYMLNEEDKKIANGNVAICIIDPEGGVYGKMFGSGRIRARASFKVAWTKSSQVFITGMKTGVFEKMAFNNEVDESKYGIERPDFIGWEGGQPIILPDGTKLSVGFSGFRGVIDLEIVVKALKKL
ncbi:MAG: hypothetical protein NVS9B7_28900 [Flavisolibacter sp.]